VVRVLDIHLPPQQIDPTIAAMIRRSQRSWWQAIYQDGRILSEWDTISTGLRNPLGDQRASHWELVNKTGMVGLRLLCPNGMCGHLKAPAEYRFFQLKAAHISVGAGQVEQATDAHIIGVITDLKGSCFCRAWEYGPQRLIEFYDNVFGMKYANIGRLSLDIQGVRMGAR